MIIVHFTQESNKDEIHVHKNRRKERKMKSTWLKMQLPSFLPHQTFKKRSKYKQMYVHIFSPTVCKRWIRTQRQFEYYWLAKLVFESNSHPFQNKNGKWSPTRKHCYRLLSVSYPLHLSGFFKCPLTCSSFRRFPPSALSTTLLCFPICLSASIIAKLLWPF